MSIDSTRKLWNTRNDGPSLRSTLAGWTIDSSNGSILTRPSAMSLRIVPSERAAMAAAVYG